MSKVFKFLSLVLIAAAACFAQAPAEKLPQLDRFDASLLDKSKDPCTDFFAYSCSKWQASHPIPADMATVGVYTPLFLYNQTILREAMERAAADPAAKGTEQQVGDYWKSCMNLDERKAHGMAWLAEALKPVDAVKSKHDLARLLAQLHNGLIPAFEAGDNQTTTAFFGFGSSQDLEDSSKMVAGFDQGGLSLPAREYYLNDDQPSKELREQFKKHLVRMFKLAGDSDEQAAREAAAVFAIESALAAPQMNSVDRRDPTKTYNKRSLAQIKAAMPDFDVDEYLKTTGAAEPPFYIVMTPEFFPALNQQIKTRSLDELKSYLRWWVIRSAASKTTPELEQANFDFFGTVLEGTPQMLPQWRRCVASADARMGEALGKEYVKIAFPPESKAKAVELMNGIRVALKQDIGSLEWMSPATKKQAVEKLDAMIQKIGYPDKWRDYSAMKIVSNNFFQNAISAEGFEIRRQLNKINKPVDRMEWMMTPATINAYNDPQNNTINFPAGILQLPYFSPTEPDAVNYGATGATIGHEITHGFDDQGRKFDAKGNLRDWWTDADAKAYDERGNCLAAENTHPVPELGPEVRTNGKLTQGEDTADDGGVRLALAALENLYKSLGKPMDVPEADGLTARQRFYAAYAFSWCETDRPEAERKQIATDPHSLPRFRVNVPLSNMPDFARAFGCKAGQPMVREHACRIW
jgi:endothelin-converting enzyme/putative endopeptidase